MTKWNDLQLRFSLDLDDVQDDAAERAITADEARLISETARQAVESRIQSGELTTGEKPVDWIGEYTRLIELGWPWRIAVYIAWAASPKQTRWPATLQDLATQVLGLTGPRVIYTWRKKHPSIDTVIAMMQAAPLYEHRADVLKALVEMASKPDYKSHNDRKLFLEMTGDYVPRSQMEINRKGTSDLSELSDAELDALLGDQVDHIRNPEENNG